MKSIYTVLFLFMSFAAQAQVQFHLEHVKNKNAHVVYTEIVNTFSVVKPNGVTIKNISTSAGNLQMLNYHTFVLYIQQEQDAPVELRYTMVKNGSGINQTYPVKYIVKKLPDYYRLKVGDYTKSGEVPLRSIRNNHQIQFNDADFNGDLKNTFIRFDFILVSPGGKTFELKNLSSNNAKDLQIFNQKTGSLKKGDKLIFQNVKAVLDSGASRNMDELTLMIR